MELKRDVMQGKEYAEKEYEDHLMASYHSSLLSPILMDVFCIVSI